MFCALPPSQLAVIRLGVASVGVRRHVPGILSFGCVWFFFWCLIFVALALKGSGVVWFRCLVGGCGSLKAFFLWSVFVLVICDGRGGRDGLS